MTPIVGGQGLPGVVAKAQAASDDLGRHRAKRPLDGEGVGSTEIDLETWRSRPAYKRIGEYATGLIRQSL